MCVFFVFVCVCLVCLYVLSVLSVLSVLIVLSVLSVLSVCLVYLVCLVCLVCVKQLIEQNYCIFAARDCISVLTYCWSEYGEKKKNSMTLDIVCMSVITKM